eukprot:379479_1
MQYMMFKSLKRVQYGINHTYSVFIKCNAYQMQMVSLSYRNFTENSIKNDNNESIQELPDPHVLIEDLDDPIGKPRYNDDNSTDDETKIEADVNDEMFVDGCIAAMSDIIPDVLTVTEEEKEDMIKFVQKNRQNRFNKNRKFLNEDLYK